MKKDILIYTALSALAIGVAILPALAGEKYPEPAGFDAVVKSSWKKVEAEEWKVRLDQDEMHKTCSLYRNQPPKDVADKLVAAEKATVVFPADGKVMGDWKKGEAVAQNGRGGQFSDKPDTVNGGNCYACHQLNPKEVSFGTIGPSLSGYGKLKNFDAAAAKDTFAKIYNSQSVLACSNMPRFGIHKFLSEEQIKDVVALLFDPESPVNK